MRVSELPRLVVWTLAFTISVTGCQANAALKGDVELLKMAAMRYRSNLEKLRTWAGKANIQFVRERFDEMEGNELEGILIEAQADFAYDSSSGKYRYKIDKHKDVSVVEGEEVPRLRMERRGRIFSNGVFHELVFKTDNPNANRTAYVRAEKSLQPSIGYLTFEPPFFFTDQGTPFDEQLEVLHENYNHEALLGEVLREGNEIVVKRDTLDSSVAIQLRLDLTRGGNPTKLDTVELGEESARDWVVLWSWERVNNVWVPAQIVQLQTFKEDGVIEKKRTTIDWISHFVNEGLADDEFTLPRLGLRQGDRVRDTLADRSYVFEGAESLPETSAPPNAAPRR